MRAWPLGLTVLMFGLPFAAAADIRDVVNRVRARGCTVAAARIPLRANVKLDQAAVRLRDGSPLPAALTAARYPSAQSAAVHLSGALGEEQIAQSLQTAYCLMLSDPELRDIGIQQRGQDVWIVLAAPLPVPADGDAPAIERHVLQLINAARALGRRCGEAYFPPAPALALNSALTRAASLHSVDMALHGEFDHRGHDGSTPSVRVRDSAYGPFRIVGENIAAGAATAEDVVEGWLSSAAHCENIMDRRFIETGVAFAVNSANAEAIYWTQDFATAR